MYTFLLGFIMWKNPQGLWFYILFQSSECNPQVFPEGKSIYRVNKLKFIYSEKATKVCEIFTLLLSYVVPVKRKVKISQNFVAFSEYMNFILSDPVFREIEV